METKRVNIYPREPITSTNPPIRGNIIATTTLLSDIKECLINNAIVEEVLPDGTTIPLTLENYNTSNSNVNKKEPVTPTEPIHNVPENPFREDKHIPPIEGVKVPEMEPQIVLEDNDKPRIESRRERRARLERERLEQQQQQQASQNEQSTTPNEEVNTEGNSGTSM